MATGSRALQRRAERASAVLTAALMLSWPALWNRYPLYISDSTEYLRDGRLVALQILHHGWATFAEIRSEIYSLGILLVDQDRSPWPIVALQAVITAWVLWLVIRSLTPSLPVRRPVTLYLALVAALTCFTSVGWYVSCLSPDSLGPVLYLSLYLLVFTTPIPTPTPSKNTHNPHDLRRWETIALCLIAWWATTAHATHLLLAAALCALLCLLWLLGWQGIQHRGQRLLLTIAVVIMATLSQISLHGWIYRQPSVFGIHPPFLMARLIADGPARLYLQQHCSTLHWTICSHVQDLPNTETAFLWQPGGIWLTSTAQQMRQLSKEEMPLALATLRTYPLAQAKCSLANFIHQLILMGPQNFNSSFLPPPSLDATLPGIYQAEQATRQAHDALPQQFFRRLQNPVIALSALLILLLLPPACLRPRDQRPTHLRLIALAWIVVFIVPANALLTGALSGLDPRYQGRVAWLLPLAAALLAISSRTSSRNPPSHS